MITVNIKVNSYVLEISSSQIIITKTLTFNSNKYLTIFLFFNKKRKKKLINVNEYNAFKVTVLALQILE